MTLRVGVDTGGTFTDICLFDDADRTLTAHKISSTPHDPSVAILHGINELLTGQSHSPATVGYFAHGTTVGTNALLTDGGVRMALITTRGFRDLIELGRGRRPKLYDLQADKPRPFVDRVSRFEVSERIRHDGAIHQPLDEDEVRSAAIAAREQGAESVAICFLYSFIRPEHERRAQAIVREILPDAYVTISSDVLPEFREYERLSTTATNAYIGPVVADYLANLSQSLQAAGITAVPHVTQSNGGIIPFDAAEQTPVRMVLSGPSTGVVGAAQICAQAGHPDIITFDMGGTSSDVSLVRDSQPDLASGMELGGRPLRTPMIDIHTVGAGGGSVGWVDAGGALKVGPHSAGSMPGPACYGNGGEPTVTDANVVLGYLHPTHLLDGSMPIDAEASRTALKKLGEPINLNEADTARGMLRIVVTDMARAIRVISVQRGYDPRDYALVPFGGAGPLHASRLARELGIATIVVPPTPGAQSALGLLTTDIRSDFSRTTVRSLNAASMPSIEADFSDLGREASAWLTNEGIATESATLTATLELRYRGQNYEIPVPVEPDRFDEQTMATAIAKFEREHERLYGYAAPGSPLEAVTYRIQARADVHRPDLSDDLASAIGHPDPTGDRMVIDESGVAATVPVYRREALAADHQLTGPAVIEQMDTTTALLAGDRARVDRHANLIIEVGQQ